MPRCKFIRLSTDDIAPEESSPPPDRVLAGDPRFKVWDAERTDRGLHAGIWECTPGKWEISYDEWEYFHILEGVTVLTPEGGEPIRLGPGDSYILRPGFKGIWEVVETTRKEYVVHI